MVDHIRISVLLPTRSRPGGLCAAVRTLQDLAWHPDEVEYLIRTDDDDRCAVGDVLPPGGPKHVKEWRGPRLGYAGMHVYYGDLAREARGDLLLIWNDDTEMLTEWWDRKLLSALSEKKPLVQFIRRDINPSADTTFPVVDRRLFDAAGYLAKHLAVDSWLEEVCKLTGLGLFRQDVVFKHHRFDDKLNAENQAVAVPECSRFYNDPAMIAAREEHARVWREYVGRLG